jgi:hypothetical protein
MPIMAGSAGLFRILLISLKRRISNSAAPELFPRRRAWDWVNLYKKAPVGPEQQKAPHPPGLLSQRDANQ